MSKPPYSYTDINRVYSRMSPSTVHVKNSNLYMFFASRLMRKAFNIYKFTLPDKWDYNFFMYTLFGLGYMSVFRTNKFGIIPMDCGLTGFNVFYQPHMATVNNPLFDRSYELVVGRDCEIIHLQPDYHGILDIVGYYADQMAITAESLSVNTFNSRLAYIFMCDNKGAKDSYAKMMDLVLSGNPAAFLYKGGLTDEATGKPKFELFNNNLKQGFIAPELQDVLRKWEYEFCREIGIPCQSTEKKQRMTEEEVNSSSIEVTAEAEVRLDCLKRSFEKVRNMFNFTESELSVDWNHDPMERYTAPQVQAERG